MPRPDGAGDKVIFTVPPAWSAAPCVEISVAMVFRVIP
jgi:hypothetical protein